MKKDIISAQLKKHFNYITGFILSIFFICVIFWLLSGICFGILDIITRLQNTKLPFHCSWDQFLTSPGYVFTLYDEWWKIFIKSLRLFKPVPVLYLPFIAIIASSIVAISLIIRQEYAVRLWYILNFHFAKLNDIKKMGLDKNPFMVLGRFAGNLLGTKQNESVLCVGEMGTGKTSSISIPSVLRSDNSCVVAVDLTGLLPKHTAGHRAKLGEVYYFNWDSLDEPQNNVYYPRWNPLSLDNLPSEQIEVENYFQRLASYLAGIDDEEKDNYWNLITQNFIVAVFYYWLDKISQAQANDYFLQKITSDTALSNEDKDLLLSYYIQMPKKYTETAIEALNECSLDGESYMPIGSWGGTIEGWIGHDLCFALITDWLIHNYANSADKNGADWSQWLKSLLDESEFFAYSTYAIDGLSQVLSLSPKQRAMVMERIVKAFTIFTVPSIRERTNGNDIDLSNLRGIYNEETAEWQPITVYSLANTHASKIMNQIFIDEILARNLQEKGCSGSLPLLLVLDDLGHNMRLKNLTSIMNVAAQKKISTLLLCNSLSLVANTYSRDELEDLIMFTDYKIIKAISNRHLSQQMDKLASFSTRSVEIPALRKRKCLGRIKPYADAKYFHKLAKDFKLCSDLKLNTHNCQVVLARGFYNRPIIANNVFFADDDFFSRLAALPANYTLPIQKILQKDEQDLCTPTTDYLTFPQQQNIKKAPLADNNDVSSVSKDEDWWLNEDAFARKSKSSNPFKFEN